MHDTWVRLGSDSQNKSDGLGSEDERGSWPVATTVGRRTGTARLSAYPGRHGAGGLERSSHLCLVE